MSALLGLYHGLPAPLRDAAASLRGLYLRGWRYGPETERLVEEALARERWTPAQWQTYQDERLGALLERAATRVPFYRGQWARRRASGERASPAYLENWPVLDKDALRADPRAFLADDCNPRALFAEHTSGTSGKPLSLWWSRAMVRQWYALCEARWRRWYGVSRRDRWAILGGQLVVPVGQQKPPFWVHNHALNQLYLSSYHLKPEFIPDYAGALAGSRVMYLWGYTSALAALARGLNERGQRLPLKVVVANAEPVYPDQREAIERAFDCSLRETYGMAEAVAAAGECEAGRLHLWPEIGVVETDGAGALICTGLLNVDMPLIRYRVGDSGALAPPNTVCACGRGLPLLDSIEGRSDDLLYLADGRRVGRLDPVFKSDLPIREAQIIQETLDRFHLRLVPASGYTPAAGQTIADRLRARVGPVEVQVETVDSIPRAANGKFKAVVCLLTDADIRESEARP